MHGCICGMDGCVWLYVWYAGCLGVVCCVGVRVCGLCGYIGTWVYMWYGSVCVYVYVWCAGCLGVWVFGWCGCMLMCIYGQCVCVCVGCVCMDGLCVCV